MVLSPVELGLRGEKVLKFHCDAVSVAVSQCHKVDEEEVPQ